MIKAMGFLVRREGMSVAEFQQYWREVHGPLMAQGPGMRRYVQNHALPELYDSDTPPPYDGFSEAWFDSLEAYAATRSSLEWQRGVADAPNLIGRSTGVIVTEVPIIDAFPAPQDRQEMVKWVTFLRRRPGMTVEEFQRYWREVHGPLVVAGIPTMRRYVQNHVLPETYMGATSPAYDGIPTAWFDSFEVFRQIRGTPPGQRSEAARAATADTVNFVQAGPIPSMVVREVLMIDQATGFVAPHLTGSRSVEPSHEGKGAPS